MCRRLYYRLHPFLFFLLTCCLFILIQYFATQLFDWQETPSPILTRLYPHLPITFNLQSYSVCHPKKLYLENITSSYHHYSQSESCFLIEHLDGGPWWSYVTQEFAEILTYLKEIGRKSNITYRSFPPQSDFHLTTNLRKYFLNACQFNENHYIENPFPIFSSLGY